MSSASQKTSGQRTGEAEARIDEFLMGAGLKPRARLVVLNPGAGRPDKRWSTASFRKLRWTWSCALINP